MREAGGCWLTMIVFLVLMALGTAHSNGASKSSVEKQFQKWVSGELWSQAKAKGISRNGFKKAMAGVSVNWKLPDLVMPGSKPKKSRPQSQAEFRSPASYFAFLYIIIGSEIFFIQFIYLLQLERILIK